MTALFDSEEEEEDTVEEHSNNKKLPKYLVHVHRDVWKQWTKCRLLEVELCE